ncbi:MULTISPECIES: restriction endonuclease subunit S [Gammaproteobacteria]|uniref:restriction endonuclease subunit S n=1 Tax=Gammaproteobacteria TaxID=1236 RepID=UPI0005A713C3|nr:MULTISPECIES: restriction endonuclease subunit S [Gammaproteobacteria]EDB5228016.1 restriction endonuclease subunit S [Salmonella enterica subsp. enterica serovar Typhimurium]MCR3952822.1 restriction endonuclease subunit S [Aeromonas hydrophila]MDE9720219.1 restriction endonuclease subunit S [Citrobacter cronae]
MVPNGWSAKPLADIVKEKISYGIVQAGPHVPDGVPYIKSSDVRGTINPYTLQRTSQEIHLKYRRSSVHPGDIVFSLRGNIGESAIVPASLPEANLTQGTARISVSAEHSNQFHYYQLASEKILNRVNALSKGSTFKEISLEELRKVKVLCAPLPEQNKIAQILSSWDKAISTTEQLLANSQQQKKALMQQLLTGKKRLLDKNGVRFSGEWKTYKFSSLFNERVETGRDDLPLLSITADDGVVYQEDTGRKNTSNEDKSKYRRICVNDIGYNTMRMWQGRSSLSDKEGIVSPAYTIVTPTSKVCPAYAAYLFKFPALVHIFYRHSQGLVSDTWNLKFNHFKNISWQVPSIDEQQKIAAVLSTADKEVTALQQKLDALKQEKQALMQQLLTGKRRVKVEVAA